MPTTTPGIGALLDRLRPFLSDMAADILAQARTSTPSPTLHPATVVSVDPIGGTVLVLPDGSGFNVRASSLIPQPTVGRRVMLLFMPPSGVFAIGHIGGDEATPRGTLGGPLYKVADPTGITNVVVAIGGLSRAVLVGSNRLIKGTVTIRGVYSTIANDEIEIFIRRDGAVFGSAIFSSGPTAGTAYTGGTVTGTDLAVNAGVHTYDVAVQRVVGTGSMSISTANGPMQLLIEDAGSSLLLP